MRIKLLTQWDISRWLGRPKFCYSGIGSGNSQRYKIPLSGQVDRAFPAPPCAHWHRVRQRENRYPKLDARPEIAHMMCSVIIRKSCSLQRLAASRMIGEWKLHAIHELTSAKTETGT